MRISEKRGDVMTDTTNEESLKLDRDIKALQELIAKHGNADD